MAYRSIPAAVSLIQSGHTVFIHTAAATPRELVNAMSARHHELKNVRLVSKTRNIFYFTGEYKGKTISVGASGMGCASIGIYSYELYTEYDEKCQQYPCRQLSDGTVGNV